MTPLRFLLVCVAGWMNQRQQLVIEYLRKEIRVLQQQLAKRPRFNEDQCCRLAAKGMPIGRKGLARFASIVTPDTLLAWHRHLIAKQYDSSKKRKPGRPPTKMDIRGLFL
jgi:putative transposase